MYYFSWTVILFHQWITSTLDPGLLKAEYSGELLTALRNCEIDYKVEECIYPSSVTWERRLQNVSVDEGMAVSIFCGHYYTPLFHP